MTTADLFMAKVLADVARMNEVTRTEPWRTVGRAVILLTAEQVEVVADVNCPDPDNLPAWEVGVGRLAGMSIRRVDTFEESTPFLLGWVRDRDRHLAHPELPDHTTEELES
ncbi:hypothetical protein [Lentzea sp. NPDC092896]|uniref:hypothetical protein n=1 Tax=Lentzea sp. NPDC092896 TaxID=3364127 RepID=UPI003825DA66